MSSGQTPEQPQQPKLDAAAKIAELEAMNATLTAQLAAVTNPTDAKEAKVEAQFQTWREKEQALLLKIEDHAKARGAALDLGLTAGMITESVSLNGHLESGLTTDSSLMDPANVDDTKEKIWDTMTSSLLKTMRNCFDKKFDTVVRNAQATIAKKQSAKNERAIRLAGMTETEKKQFLANETKEKAAKAAAKAAKAAAKKAKAAKKRSRDDIEADNEAEIDNNVTVTVTLGQESSEKKLCQSNE